MSRLRPQAAGATTARPARDCTVVVTPRSFGIHEPGLRHELERSVAEVRYWPGPLTAAELADAVADADGLLAGLDDVSAEVFARARRLRVVARYGVGYDRVDLLAAARHGVTVTVTRGANANAVAELTLALLFMVARPIIRGIVSRSLLKRVRTGAALINTARGELINETALEWALEDGPLRAAALDVLAAEPPPPHHPLLRRDDVLVTPHISPHTAEATTAMGRAALDDLLAVLSGRRPRFPVPAGCPQ